MKTGIPHLGLFVLVGMWAWLMSACAQQPTEESIDPPTVTWEITVLSSGASSSTQLGSGHGHFELRTDQSVRVSLIAEDPIGINGIHLVRRGGLYKCRLGEEVRFNRSINLGSTGQWDNELENSKSLDLLITPSDWRCWDGFELVGSFVHLEGTATNTHGRSASIDLYVVQ
jgi:hypothetical protein